MPAVSRRPRPPVVHQRSRVVVQARAHFDPGVEPHREAARARGRRTATPAPCTTAWNVDAPAHRALSALTCASVSVMMALARTWTRIRGPHGLWWLGLVLRVVVQHRARRASSVWSKHGVRAGNIYTSPRLEEVRRAGPVRRRPNSSAHGGFGVAGHEHVPYVVARHELVQQDLAFTKRTRPVPPPRPRRPTGG
jgi:hypothetical protein